MRLRRSVMSLVAAVLAACLMLSCNSRPSASKSAETEKAATAQALQKFDQIKFGMFIHWGLYAIPAGEWKGQVCPGHRRMDHESGRRFRSRNMSNWPSSSTR